MFKFFQKQILMICIAGLVLFAGQALAQERSWGKLNGPYGPGISDLVINPLNPTIMYVGLDGGGVYKTKDGGDNWIDVSTGSTDLWAITSMTMDPSNPQVLYVGDWNSGIYKTTDGGASWQDISSGITFPGTQTVWCIAVNPDNPQVVYAGTHQHVWKSTDGGITWTEKGAGMDCPKVYSLAIDPVDTNILYAGTIFGDINCLYKTTDGGENWTILISHTTYFHSIVIDPDNHLTVYVGTDAGSLRSIDGGNSWLPTDDGLINTHVRDYAIDPVIANVVYTATWGGLYKSTHFGDSWTQIGATIDMPFVKTVNVDPSDPQTLYQGAFGGIWKSTDGGINWELKSTGLYRNTQIANECLAVDPTDGKTIYAATYSGGIFKTTDAGKTWKPRNVALSIAMGNGGVAIVSNDPNVVYLGTDGGGIFKSTNGGDSWTQKNNGIPSEYSSIGDIRIDPLNPQVLYISSGLGGFRSTDGAENWTAIDSGIKQRWDQNHPEEFCIVPGIDGDQSTLLYMAAHQGVYTSTNAGKLWIDITNGLPAGAVNCRCVRVDPTDSRTVYLGTSKAGAFKTTDGGAHWTEINNGLTAYGTGIRIIGFVIDPGNTQHVYVGLYGSGMFESLDGGASWNPINLGLDNKIISALTSDPNNPSILYVGTGSGIFKWPVPFPGIERNTPLEPFTVTNASATIFHTEASIRFSLPETAPIRITVYDESGQMVSTLLDETRQAGIHTITWNGKDETGKEVTSGVYFCKLESQGHSFTLKLVRVR